MLDTSYIILSVCVFVWGGLLGMVMAHFCLSHDTFYVDLNFQALEANPAGIPDIRPDSI